MTSVTLHSRGGPGVMLLGVDVAVHDADFASQR
jgi:hypothetical protein